MLIERQLGIVPHLTRQFQERLSQMETAKACEGARLADRPPIN
jgi:hypothetical protein